MGTRDRGRAGRLARFLGLVDDRPKPGARQVLRALWRTLPYVAVAAVLGVVVELLGAPSWVTTVVLAVPVVAVVLLLEQERDRS